MRIVFVNRFFHPDHSATSQLLGDLAFHVAGSGIEVVVITSRTRIDQPRATLGARERIHGVEVHRVWSTRFGRDWLPGRAIDYLSFYLGAMLAAMRLVGRDDVLVAATDPPMISVPMSWVARVRGARLVNWVHDLFPEVAERLGVRLGPLAGVLRAMRNRALVRARCNVVLGDRMAEVVRSLGIEPRRIKVIHNWFDGARIEPDPPASRVLRARWGIDDGFVVGYSGNMGRAHAFAGVLEAAWRLRDEPGIRFVFIGGGAQADCLARAVSRRGLDNVLFKPYQPRAALADSLGAIDLHLVILRPALEGLIVPSKFYGVAAAGRPCLFLGAVDGEIARILARHACGMSAHPDDADAIAGVIRDLAADPARARAMGQRARRALLENYDQRKALAAWEAVLSS